MEPVKELNLTDILLPVAVIIFIIAAGIVLLNNSFQKKIYMQKLEQESMKLVHEKEMLRTTIYAQEEERKRTAQDLHDELGATLSIMRMHLLLIRQDPAIPGKIVQGIENVRELSEKAMASVRAISHQLMPPQLERFGLAKALESVIAQIEKAGKIKIRMTTLNEPTTLSWDLSLAFYRIIMELLNNTIRHSDAGNIHIHFSYVHPKVTCVYTDDGKGLSEKNTDSGLGFKNIQARTSALSGEITLSNPAHKGFYASICIPVENNSM